MIFNTPERLLAHEFTHRTGQFSEYYRNTFTYWINGVYLEMCNFRSGRCEDPDQAANTPQN
ncbi:transcriptional regulator family: Fungal Specific TF [Penicillium sp. IBT 18751x]|nr:transcriptional regulator family: Fungal Specific TF [Penicillium sp. IBT 18751x]